MIDVDPSTFNVLSLCSGYGGLDLAVHRTVRGARTVAYVEREAYAAAILAARMEEGRLSAAPIWSDLTTFDARPWRGVVDFVVGGFPCQDLSVAGKGAGLAGERSGLWFHVARVIDECRPRYVLLENVPPLVKRGLDVVLGQLAAMGFDAEWGCYSAAEAGAPHRRERIFILGYATRDGRSQGRTEHAVRSGWSSASVAGGEVSDADRARLEGRGLAIGGGADERLAGEAGTEVAHPLRLVGLAESGEQRLGDGTEARRVLGGGSSDVSDALSQPLRLQPERDQREGRGVRAPIGGDAVTVHDGGTWRSPFPPGPDDFDGWREFFATHPDAEPAITQSGVRGDVDGPTAALDRRLHYRVDRLRACGNGVVPQQAELALRELWERAHRA